MKPEPPVTRMRPCSRSQLLPAAAIAIHAPVWCERRAASISCCTRKPSAKPGCVDAAVLDGVEEILRQPRHRRDAAVGILRVGRIVDRECARTPSPAAWREAVRSRACSRRPDCAAPACRPRRRIRCGARCRDRRRSSSTGSPAGPLSNCSAIATVVCSRALVGQAGDARRQPGDRPAEPFEIMEAVRDEIAEHAAAVVAADGLPVAHAHLDRAAFDLPIARRRGAARRSRRRRASPWRAASSGSGGN